MFDQSTPAGITEDGVVVYDTIRPEAQQRIAGVNPATGLPDDRFAGTITAAVPIGRLADALHPTPSPAAPQLVAATRASDLFIARDLGVGLAELAASNRLDRDAAAARALFDPTRGRP